MSLQEQMEAEGVIASYLIELDKDQDIIPMRDMMFYANHRVWKFFCGLGGIFMLISLISNLSFLIAGILFFLLGVYMAWGHYIGLIEAFKEMFEKQNLDIPTTLTITKDGLWWQNSLGYMKYPWTSFTHYRENKNYLACFRYSVYIILPKRFVPDKDGLEFIKTKIPKSYQSPYNNKKPALVLVGTFLFLCFFIMLFTRTLEN